MQPLLAALLLAFLPAMSHASDLPQFLEPAHRTVETMAKGVETVSAERRHVLDDAAEYIAGKLSAGSTAKLNFICTHNSRRSHLAQVWAQVAADYYGLERVQTFSGGTEATACNVRTAEALRRAGLEVVNSTMGDNPHYLAQYAQNRMPQRLYSKVYTASPNPQNDYAALLCCSDADAKCPVVMGADIRIALHYSDPKIADETPQESATYDERSREIGREMFYVLGRAAHLLGRK